MNNQQITKAEVSRMFQLFNNANEIIEEGNEALRNEWVTLFLKFQAIKGA